MTIYNIKTNYNYEFRLECAFLEILLSAFNLNLFKFFLFSSHPFFIPLNYITLFFFGCRNGL